MIEFAKQTNTEDQSSLLHREEDNPNTVFCSLAGKMVQGDACLSIDISDYVTDNKMNDIATRRKQRNDFLIEVYEETNGSTTSSFDIDAIGKSLNLDRDTAIETCLFWSNKGYINLIVGGAGWITHNGIEAAEEMLEDEGHTYIASSQSPGNTVNNHINISNSTLNGGIQQGVTNTSSYDQQRLSRLQQFTSSTLEHIDKLGLTPEDHKALLADIHAVDRELRSSNPEISVIEQSLQSGRNIMEGITGSVIATGLVELLKAAAR